MRPIFHHRELQQLFECNGYVVVDFLDSTQVDLLLEAWRCLPSDVGGMPFSNTIMSRDTDYRWRVHETVLAVFSPCAAALFDACRPCLCTFIAKMPAEGSIVQLHQDWSFVDESRYLSAGIWCPLVDTTSENGCLQVVPGSHRLNSRPRGFQELFPYTHLLDRLKRDYLVEVPMKAGQALIYTQALFHSSPPNRSARERVVAGGLMIPEESKLRFLMRDPANYPRQLKIYEVPDNFYQNYVFGSPLDETAAVGFVEEGWEPLTVERLESVLGERHAAASV